eukprot:SAG25_NODE_4991_length_718_cov_0.937097_1_plen_38_part_01
MCGERVQEPHERALLLCGTSGTLVRMRDRNAGDARHAG